MLQLTVQDRLLHCPFTTQILSTKNPNTPLQYPMHAIGQQAARKHKPNTASAVGTRLLSKRKAETGRMQARMSMQQ